MNQRDASAALDRIERALATLAEANALMRATLQQLPALIDALSAMQDVLDPPRPRPAHSSGRLWTAAGGEGGSAAPKEAAAGALVQRSSGRDARYDLWGRAP
jgi:hypothetical protein